jgi:hypothetical protein
MWFPNKEQDKHWHIYSMWLNKAICMGGLNQFGTNTCHHNKILSHIVNHLNLFWDFPKSLINESSDKCWALESEFLEAWAILHKFLKQGCCRHIFLSHRLIHNKQRNNYEATKMMARKIHVCIKNWGFHLVTPPKRQKLPSSILKTAHVKFWATSGSLSTTLWWYYRDQN